MRPAAVAGLLTLLLTGCAAGGTAPATAPQAEGPGSAVPSAVVPSARVGAPAASTRVRFPPTSVRLPGGAQAEVKPASTVAGTLQVPENVRSVGWWDGSAWVGDPFGTTVIAGHVDSASEGLGYFARLLRIERGDVVTVAAGRHQARYRVTSVRTVAKQALATSSSAFDQSGDHRLVLITCTGAYDAARGGYASNLVVTAAPLGPAR